MFHVFRVLSLAHYVRADSTGSLFYIHTHIDMEHVEHMEQILFFNYLHCSTFYKDVEQTWNSIGLRGNQRAFATRVGDTGWIPL